MRFLYAPFLLIAGALASVEKFNRNLVFRSPFSNEPHFAHDTVALSKRAIRVFRRDTVCAEKFKDESYPKFYGSDFSNAPVIWSSGVNFTHSVASGDPFDTSVILWTRAMPLPDGSGNLPDQSVPVCVSYQISTSSHLSGKPVDSGEAFTTYDVDFTVKVEAQKLRPDTIYFYQFSDCTNPKIVSPIGKTRTLPSSNTPAEKVNGGKPLNIAVFSCAQFQAGWFNAYGYATQKLSVDLNIQIGDYYYEEVGDGGPIGRAVLGRELATIHDYRQRLGQYRSDPDLQLSHESAPWITICPLDRAVGVAAIASVLTASAPRDDHEVADNAWKAGTTDSNDTAAGCTFSPSGACFTDRKFAGIRAYHEWMPIRQVDAGDTLRIWRSFSIGKMADLIMLDTRQYNRDVTDVGYNHVVQSLADEPNRSLMGANQEKWLLDTLDESNKRGAVWKLIGQQIVFSQVSFEGVFNLDAWDGYRQNRERIVNHLYNNHVSNTIVLSGDSHANWVSDLSHPNDTKTYDPVTGHGAIGVEFAGTGVTAKPSFFDPSDFNQSTLASEVLVGGNIDLQWNELYYRGFFTLTMTAESLTASYYGMRNVTFRNLDGFEIARFTVKAGENRISRPVAGGHVLSGALRSQVVH